MIVPFDARLAAQAAKLGKTLAEVAKGSKTGIGLMQVMDETLAIIEDADGTPRAKAKGGSLMGRFTDFKSMLPAKKDKKAAAES